LDISCPKCRQTVPMELPLCLSCGAELLAARPKSVDLRPAANLSQKPPAGSDPDALRIDVRARVMWGEERQAIRADLLKQGVPAAAADRLIGTAIRERQDQFRKLGFSNVLTAVGFAVGFLLTMVLFLFTGGRLPAFQVTAVLWGLMGIFLFGALFYFFRGIRRMLRAGEGERGATDVEDEDLLPD